MELIYKLEFGKLEVSTRLDLFSDEYLSAELIPYRDALVKYAREKYGLLPLPLPDLGHMGNAEDQTEQILAMTK